MNKSPTENTIDDDRITEFELSLIKLYGVVIGGDDLVHILGYRSGDAFRQSVFRKQLPFPTFMLEGRKKRMARARDIATWLASLDTVIENTSASCEDA
ncbi:MAG: hypothetical protein GQ573_01930 [Gammaproteobacteria bacterium]|nr:hypothetical protein [Gammaproteobacteria bacterium]